MGIKSKVKLLVEWLKESIKTFLFSMAVLCILGPSIGIVVMILRPVFNTYSTLDIIKSLDDIKVANILFAIPLALSSVIFSYAKLKTEGKELSILMKSGEFFLLSSLSYIVCALTKYLVFSVDPKSLNWFDKAGFIVWGIILMISTICGALFFIMGLIKYFFTIRWKLFDRFFEKD